MNRSLNMKIWSYLNISKQWDHDIFVGHQKSKKIHWLCFIPLDFSLHFTFTSEIWQLYSLFFLILLALFLSSIIFQIHFWEDIFQYN